MEYERVLARQRVEPFKRGVMMFEDYNYDQFNKYILVDPNRAEGEPHMPLPGGFEP